MKSILDLIGLGKSQSGGEAARGDMTKKVEEWTMEKWKALKNAYVVFHQNTWRCRLFAVGESYIDVDRQTKYWIPATPKDEWVPQPRFNQFTPAVDGMLANFNTVPEIEAEPQPKDDARAMGIAEIANELCSYVIKDNALRADYKSKEDRAGQAAIDFVLSGCCFTDVHVQSVAEGKRPKKDMQNLHGFQCVDCDLYQTSAEPVANCPQCGKPVTSSPTGQLAEAKDEQGETVMEDVVKKRIVIEIADPLEIFPRPGAKNMAGTPYLIYATRLSLDDIWYRWNYEATADSEYPDSFNLMMEYSLNYYYVGYTQNSNQAKDGALVIQAYAEPNRLKDYPEGFYAVCVNGKCIHYKTWAEEFPEAEHPITMGCYQQMSKIFFPRTPAFDLCDLQKSDNELNSAIELHAKVSAADTLVIDKRVAVTKPTGRADKIIYGQPVSSVPLRESIFRLQHGSMDEGIYLQRGRIKDQFQTVSHDVSVFHGEQPGSVTAASGLALLRGQAELQYAKPTQNWNALWKETVRKAIKCIQKNWSVVEIAEIVGSDKMTQISDFLKADLDKCLNFTATMTGLPRTRDERRQEMMLLYDKGALDLSDPNVKQKIFELFGETGMLKTFSDDARRARINIRNIRTTGQCNPFRPDIDDPETHRGIALEAAKSIDFDAWPPQAQDALYAYIKSIPPPEAKGDKGKGPSESISYKDLPPEGKMQMAAQAGISLSPESVVQQHVEQTSPGAAPQGANLPIAPSQGSK
jgi:hypothetical protein